MIDLLNENIRLFYGFDNIKLYSNIDEVKLFLKENQIPFNVEIWQNKDCVPQVAWVLIKIANSITLFFANNKLWKIYLENDYCGKLDNGIKLNMKMEQALNIDNTLKYDDWNEDYISNSGYFLEDDIEMGTILSISVVIKEALNEELFYKYDW